MDESSVIFMNDGCIYVILVFNPLVNHKDKFYLCNTVSFMFRIVFVFPRTIVYNK